MALWSKHLWPGGLKKIDIQLIIFKLIVRNNCSSVCVRACVRTHVHVYVCVCVCVGCISAEFYYSIPTGNMSFTLWLFAFLYMILPSVSLSESVVLVYSDVSSVQLEACLLARFCVYYNLCDVQK